MPQLTVEAGTHSWARSAHWGWCEDPKIGSVELLDCDAKLAFEQREDGLHIHLPFFLSEIRESMHIRPPSCPTEGLEVRIVCQFEPPPSGAEARSLSRHRAT